jgi:hypothetical protein
MPTTQRPATSTPRRLQRLQLLGVHHCNVSPCYFSTCKCPTVHRTTTVTMRSSTCCHRLNRQPSTCNCISSVPVVTASMPLLHCPTVATFYHAMFCHATFRDATFRDATFRDATFRHETFRHVFVRDHRHVPCHRSTNVSFLDAMCNQPLPRPSPLTAFVITASYHAPSHYVLP